MSNEEQNPASCQTAVSGSYTTALIDNGFDDIYVFNVSYMIIRKGDKGKILKRPRKEEIGSPYFDGKNITRMIKEKYGDNTEIHSVEFVRQYNVDEKLKSINSYR